MRKGGGDKVGFGLLVALDEDVDVVENVGVVVVVDEEDVVVAIVDVVVVDVVVDVDDVDDVVVVGGEVNVIAGGVVVALLGIDEKLSDKAVALFSRATKVLWRGSCASVRRDGCGTSKSCTKPYACAP